MGFDDYLPREAIGKTLRVVLMGRGSVLVERHRGVITYLPDQLKLRLENGYLEIRGHSLRIREYSAGDAAVEGVIDSLKFMP